MTHLVSARLVMGSALVALFTGCASAPAVNTPPAQQLTFEQKMAWILRLEEDRVLRGPEAPPPPAPPPGRRGAQVVPVPPSPSLLTLVTDAEARVRRRAALAIGRTRLADGVPALVPLLAADPEPEVRQMAAFAMGLIGGPSIVDPLLAALQTGDPLVQGRAAEALGLAGHKQGADAIAAMLQPHVKSGVLSGISPDDLEHPKSPAVEAVRLGTYALVRLGAYDQLASALLDANGRPVSDWWPVAYAFRRINDPRAGTPLLALLQSPGATTRAFAARGLGIVKEARAAAPLTSIVATEKESVNVRIEAARSLADLGDVSAADALLKVVTSASTSPNLLLEAVTALGQLRAGAAVDVFVELLTHSWPTLRAAATTALARTDADAFLLAVSGLDPDTHWSVRAALANALASLPERRGEPRLIQLLKDEDQRVLPAVLNALATMNSPDAEAQLLARLDADDPVVRQAAIAALARVKSPTAAAALAQAYERAEKDPWYGVRTGILAALAEMEPGRARPLIERALTDRDWAVRVRAAALLRTLDPTSNPAAQIRPAPAAALPELNELERMANPSVSPVAYIETTKGTIQVELAVLDAPRTVTNFISLARRNFLGATPFHRVVPNFVIQDGDPRGDGEGGPGYTIRDEINQRPYLRGTVGMALDWEDTGGSQFFITHSPQPHLDARYTVFGRVIEGMDVVERIQQWDQVRAVRIWDGVNWIGGQ